MNYSRMRLKDNKKQIHSDKPIITIITIVLNGDSILEETILSVLNQTYNNIEYIIIDGGSTDNTLNVIKKYEEKIDCWISEPDNGIYDAMNKGIDIATGEWINFMNAGDSFFSYEVLNLIFGKKINDNVSLLYGDTIYRNHDRGIIHIKPAKIKYLWKGMCFGHQASFVKTNVMKLYKYNVEYRNAADYNFIFSLYNDGYKFEYISIPVSLFLLGGISDNNVDSLKERMEIVFKKNKNIYYILFYKYLLLAVKLRKLCIKIIGQSKYSLIRKIKWKIISLIKNI